MKTTTTITLDIELISAARKKGINLSRFINDSLKGYLDMKTNDLPEDRFKLENEVNLLKTALNQAESKLEEKNKKVVRIKG